MLKRLSLFFGVNILVMITVTIILSLLGVGGYIEKGESGLHINYLSLLVVCSAWGMGGSFISLLISKKMAKILMGVKILNPSGANNSIVQAVHHMAQTAGLSKMPEVGIYPSSDVNAFATGPSRNNSLVAISQGAMDRLRPEEIKGILAHEVAHIANGDMVTMALMQGVLNAFVMFFARIAAFIVGQLVKSDDEEGKGLGYFSHILLVILFQVLFGILASVLLSWFSRVREYAADKGGAKLAGSGVMIQSLQSLQKSYPQLEKANSSMRSMQISSKHGISALFSTHPPLEDRILRLKESFT